MGSIYQMISYNLNLTDPTDDDPSREWNEDVMQMDLKGISKRHAIAQGLTHYREQIWLRKQIVKLERDLEKVYSLLGDARELIDKHIEP